MENERNQDDNHNGTIRNERRGLTEHGDKHDFDELEEKRHFAEVVHSFEEYSDDMMREIDRRQRNCQSLSFILPEINIQIHCLRRCVEANAKLFSNMLACNEFIIHGKDYTIETNPHTHISTRIRNLLKVRSTLHQCAREWSSEGESERATSFSPLLDYLKKYVPVGDGNKRVLVPGSGLGRLPAEIASLGYSCQMNEVSYHMLLMSQFILNHLSSSKPEDQESLFPWIHNPSCVAATADLTSEVRIPDTSAFEILGRMNPKFIGQAEMSMCAGEFVEVYGKQRECWHSIVTCFFIDTAPNVLEYIEVIYNALVPGGVWINGSPLLWHWQNNGPKSDEGHSDDPRYDKSIEISFEMLRSLIERSGFDIKEEQSCEDGYSSNSKSMLKSVYTIMQFVAIKR